MPFIKPRHRYIQRVCEVYGCSDPFSAVMSLADMRRFSLRIIDGKWPEDAKALFDSLLPSDGVVTLDMDRKFIAARLKVDPFDSLSARLSCAHDGRYWRTARTWSRQVPWYPGVQSFACDDVSRVLMPDEITLLLHSRCDESGWHALFRYATDIKDGPRSLARTVMEWSTKIEEAWSANGADGER